MATDDRLSGALAENILVLLCFSDEAKMIRSCITPNLWESAVYRDVCAHACDFLDQFGEPIREHLPDALEKILDLCPLRFQQTPCQHPQQLPPILIYPTRIKNPLMGMYIYLSFVVKISRK